MKKTITIYELLGLVKNGKAPKKIKVGNIELKYNEGCEDYYRYYGTGLFEYKFRNCKNFLNDEVEIIEEPKKIEYEQIEELTCNDYDFEKKTINSLIKNQRKLINEINNIKENEHEI